MVNEPIKKNILVYRRCILLAVAGSTPSTHPSVAKVVNGGFLDSVKRWLDQILDGSVGALIGSLKAVSFFLSLALIVYHLTIFTIFRRRS